jgi:hypothetical protein
VDEIQVPNSIRPSHDDKFITLYVEEITFPTSRRSRHGGITIASGAEEIFTSGMEKMPLPNSRSEYFWCAGNATTLFHKTESLRYNHYI